VGDRELRAINTLCLDVDVIRAIRVEDDEKSFLADFYVSMRNGTNSASIDQLDFPNALLDPQTHDRQLSIRVMSDGAKSDTFGKRPAEAALFGR